LADFARDTDKVDGGVEIDRRDILVAKPNLKMGRCQGGTVAIARSAIEVAGATPQAPNTSALK